MLILEPDGKGIVEKIEILIRKASESDLKSEDALRYSQAANNCANALSVLNQININNGYSSK